MRSHVDSRGYTIVETMMFLAISGLMFVVAAGFVSGKQAQTQFKQSMNDISASVTQVIDDVNNGSYPSSSNFQCIPSSSGPTIDAGTNLQGTNVGCVFIGKVIQFGARTNSSVPTDGTTFNVFSIAGNQFSGGTTSGNPVIDFTESKPIAVDTDAVNMTQVKTLQWAAKATVVYDYNSAGGGSINDISAVAFVTSFATADGSGGLVSGNQDVDAFAINQSGTSIDVAKGTSEGDMAGYIKSQLGAADSNGDTRPNPDFVVCFKGGYNEYGTLTIGGSSGERLTTSTQISSSDITASFPNGSTRLCPS